MGSWSPPRYLAELWRYRHLCFHLANADLESRFRRSTLGVLWAMIHPLAFTMLYAAVLVNLFRTESFVDFSVYVMSGLILWDAFASFFTLGSVSIISGGGYLKQSPMPMLIFPIRTSLTVMVVLTLSLISFALYVAGLSQFFGYQAKLTLHAFWVFPLFALLFVCGVAFSAISGFLNLKFRDTQQMLLILTQAVWFASPIFFPRDIFNQGWIAYWSAINPVLAICDIFRDAVINGVQPQSADWQVLGVWAGIAWLIALITVMFSDRRSIYAL